MTDFYQFERERERERAKHTKMENRRMITSHNTSSTVVSFTTLVALAPFHDV